MSISFGDDRGFTGYDTEDFQNSDWSNKERMDKAFIYGIHVDGQGNEIDMQTIDRVYANNLYNFYEKTYGHKFKGSILSQILKTKGEC